MELISKSRFQYSIYSLVLVVLFAACGTLFAACGTGSNNNADAPIESPLVNATVNTPRPNITLGTPQNVGNTTTTTTTTSTSSAQNSSIAFIMRRFLWKAISEGDGNLVVLVDPRNVRVDVFGAISETLTDFGPSNDRGTTARGSFPGCNYGSNIQVQFSIGGQRVGFIDGTSTVNIPNGCDRVEFDL